MTTWTFIDATGREVVRDGVTYLGRLCDDGEGTHEATVEVWWRDKDGVEHEGYYRCLVTPVGDLGPDPYEQQVIDDLPASRAERLVDDELTRRAAAENWVDCTIGEVGLETSQPGDSPGALLPGPWT